MKKELLILFVIYNLLTLSFKPKSKSIQYKAIETSIDTLVKISNVTNIKIHYGIKFHLREKNDINLKKFVSKLTNLYRFDHKFLSNREFIEFSNDDWIYNNKLKDSIEKDIEFNSFELKELEIDTIYFKEKYKNLEFVTSMISKPLKENTELYNFHIYNTIKFRDKYFIDVAITQTNDKYSSYNVIAVFDENQELVDSICFISIS